MGLHTTTVCFARLNISCFVSQIIQTALAFITYGFIKYIEQISHGYYFKDPGWANHVLNLFEELFSLKYQIL